MHPQLLKKYSKDRKPFLFLSYIRDFKNCQIDLDIHLFSNDANIFLNRA